MKPSDSVLIALATGVHSPSLPPSLTHSCLNLELHAFLDLLLVMRSNRPLEDFTKVENDAGLAAQIASFKERVGIDSDEEFIALGAPSNASMMANGYRCQAVWRNA